MCDHRKNSRQFDGGSTLFSLVRSYPHPTHDATTLLHPCAAGPVGQKPWHDETPTGTQARRDQAFKGRQFTAAVILWAVRWYLMFPISYRDLERMLQDRGVEVDHTTIFRLIQAYAAELDPPPCT